MATCSLSHALSADAIRAAAPRLVGPVIGGWQVDPRALVVQQCADAFAVIVDGDYVGCCPSEVYAIRAASRELARRNAGGAA